MLREHRHFTVLTDPTGAAYCITPRNDETGNGGLMRSDERTKVPFAADERSTLLGFLDRHRDTLRMKASGLDAEQLDIGAAAVVDDARRDAQAPGLRRGLVVRPMLRWPPGGAPFDDVDWDADEDWDWHSASGAPPEELFALFDRFVEASDQVITAAASLDDVAARRARNGEPLSLRWILVHMIEEYARHNGHADLIRESIDGVTGA